MEPHPHAQPGGPPRLPSVRSEAQLGTWCWVLALRPGLHGQQVKQSKAVYFFSSLLPDCLLSGAWPPNQTS